MVLARQVLFHFSHASDLFYFIFQIGSQGFAQDLDSSTYASCVAGIASVFADAWLVLEIDFLYFLPMLALNYSLHNLCLASIWNYRLEPSHPAPFISFFILLSC
jgi:hypothetical protein